MVLGSTTIQHLVALYPRVCGMTGTAATQAIEFRTVYGLYVETIPTNRPIIRVDHPDVLFPTKAEKEQAVADEIRRVHATGQPILVGTASVEESERLSGMLADLPHRVLNARNDEVEAAIVAQAGQCGAITISTNMAGRGTDIRLGEGVAALGGLYVIGTNRHESRRIDNQLRGRAGRQGDPGCSRFFISLEDPLMVKYGDLDIRYRNDPASIQRLVEGQHLDQREFLHRYDLPVEGQRQQDSFVSPGGTRWQGCVPVRVGATDHPARRRRFVGGLSGPAGGFPRGYPLAIVRRGSRLFRRHRLA